MNDDLIDYCASEEVTLLAYSPLLAGAYTREERAFEAQYRWADTGPRLEALVGVAEDLGATANQVILAWMVQSDPVVIPLVAGSTREPMAENLGAPALTQTAEQMRRLDTAGV